MNITPLEIFRSICYGDRHPDNLNLKDDIFNQMYNQIEFKLPPLESKFQIQFSRPKNEKCQYYVQLIKYSAFKYLNETIARIEEAPNESTKQFNTNHPLQRELITFIDRIDSLLAKAKKGLTHISQKDSLSPRSVLGPEEGFIDYCFVFMNLKYALIYIYLEIQENYKDYVTSIIKELNDFESNPINLLNYFEIQIERKKIQVSKNKKEAFHSYKLINYPANNNKLTDVLTYLKKINKVHEDCTLKDFKKVFSGEPIDNPIIWTGGISGLYYFIKKLTELENVTIEPCKDNHWLIATKCFIEEGGKKYTVSRIKSQKVPKKSFLEIEKAVKFLE